MICEKYFPSTLNGHLSLTISVWWLDNRSHQLRGSLGAVKPDKVIDVNDLSSDVSVSMTPTDLLAKEDEGKWGDHAAVVHVDGWALHDLVKDLKDGSVTFLEQTQSDDPVFESHQEPIL